MDNCPVCNNSDAVIEPESDVIGYRVRCNVCGYYTISSQAAMDCESNEEYKDKKHIIAGYIREASESGKRLQITRDALNHILSSSIVPNNPFEYIDKLLLYIRDRSSMTNEYIDLKSSDYSIVYAKNEDEFRHIWRLAIRLGYLEKESGRDVFRLDLDGWKRVDDLGKRIIDSSKAFVAMWFDPELEAAWNDGFKQAFIGTDYTPYKVDLDEHNDKIDDKIISEIRRSGLLVADFTNNRGNVYFEAGFALGLNIPVIWTCRSDCIDDVHFDTRQYNHVVWTTPDELKEKLHNRIIATIPKRGIRRFV